MAKVVIPVLVTVTCTGMTFGVMADLTRLFLCGVVDARIVPSRTRDRVRSEIHRRKINYCEKRLTTQASAVACIIPEFSNELAEAAANGLLHSWRNIN